VLGRHDAERKRMDSWGSGRVIASRLTQVQTRRRG
jgi:hypothetical protein